MAGMHHPREPNASISTTPDAFIEKITESVKDISIANCSKSQKKGSGIKKKKQTTTNTSKAREKEIRRPLSQASCRSKKYNLPFQKSDDTTIKSSVNRLSSSDPSGDALLRKSITGDQFRGIRHSSSSSPSQSSETAKFGAVRRKGRRGSDSCTDKDYLLPYGLRMQHAAHKCMWSGSEGSSATSPAGSSSQPSGEYIAETVTATKPSATSESRKGSEIHFHSTTQKKTHKASKKEFKFEAYMPLCEVQQSLKKGELIEGVLRINPRNYEDAYISAPDGQMDIYIGGIHDRNRALNGDVVAVQLKKPEDWKILWDDLRDYQEKCELFNNSDIEKDMRKFSNALSFLDIKEEIHVTSEHCENLNSSLKTKTTVKPIDTFEIGVFNEVPCQSEENSYLKKKKRKYRKQNNKMKQGNECIDEEEKAMDTSIILDLSEVPCTIANDSTVTCSDTVPKDDDKVFHCIPSEIASDRNCYSSTSFNKSVLCNSYSEQEIEDEPEVTVASDCYKDKELTANDPTNKEWANENDIENNQLIIIPDDISYFESSYDTSVTDTTDNIIIDEDSQSEKLCSVAVAPDELSGDEFSQSVSGDSTCSHHLDQLQEDKTFFSSLQNALNNNEDNGIENELHPVESQNHENEATIHSTGIDVHYGSTTNSSSIEATISTAANLQVPDISNSSINSTNFIIPHNNMVPDHETELIDEENKANNYKVNHLSTEPSSTFKQLISDISENMENSQKSLKKMKHKYYSNLRNKKESKGKEKLNYIMELMTHPYGKKFVQRTAKVVYILEKKHTRMAAGSLKLLQDGNFNWALFSPTDHKLPRIFIPMRDCPPGFLKRPKDFSRYLFLAKIVEWTEDSKFAKGNLIQKLGTAGEIEAETHGILLENGIDTKDFDEDILTDLPQQSNWCIPHDEIKNRRDFREECVFTIDPSTARDLDDAVSCKKLDGKIFEIGVHIADVSYFVKPCTALDSIASERATSVYLVQNVIPMLPQVLCEKLCSLNPAEDRLSFSVVWKVNAEGEILDEWFGRSIIRSCVKLSYEDAQVMIENPEKELDTNAFPHINGKFTIKEIMERVLNLNSIARKLRQTRFKDGALRLDQVKLQFCLDKESGMPSGFTIYEHRDSNRLIEEFMLLANMAVAHKIYKSFPDQALLRCHPEPEKKLMDDVVATCQALGIKLDASTSGALQASLATLSGDDIYSKARSQILTSLCSKPMKCAQYFSSGTISEPADCHHYALNVPLYTHFTSPIRRYPDIIVHRLLAASLDNNTPAVCTSNALKKLANHCNDKKYTAKRVNELSSELFLIAFIRQCGPIDDKAMVMGVMDHSFDVLVLSIGLVKRIYCDKLNLKSKHYQKENGIPQLLLHWNQGNEFIQEIKIFTLVDVTLSVQQSDLMKINAVLRYPEDLHPN